MRGFQLRQRGVRLWHQVQMNPQPWWIPQSPFSILRPWLRLWVQRWSRERQHWFLQEPRSLKKEWTPRPCFRSIRWFRENEGKGKVLWSWRKGWSCWRGLIKANRLWSQDMCRWWMNRSTRVWSVMDLGSRCLIVALHNWTKWGTEIRWLQFALSTLL